ncbi:protein chibby homolog 2 [Pogoniulus pusillus]|uniref:protein chibby homolog 2 n=1 Tax=Pogoniulus pusillus TaxID=488313 RepID=UPI0030B98576
MSAFDLTRQDMQCAEPETDSIAPRIQPRDEVLVCVDGKWVNEIYCQPPLATPWKLFSRKAQKEWRIWEENKALWEENRILQIQNRALWEENRALQCLQPHEEPIQVTYADAIQQSLQKENEPCPYFQERNTGFQVSSGNKALQAVQENKRVSKDFQQESKPVPIIWTEEEEAVSVLEESDDANSDLQEDTDANTDVEEDNPGPFAQYKQESAKKNSTPTQNKTKSASSVQGEYEIIQVLQDLYRLLHTFLKVNHLPEGKQGSHVLCNAKRSFQEDYSKLKLQLNAVKKTVSDIKAQMEMLEKELTAIASPVHEGAEHKLATEIQEVWS